MKQHTTTAQNLLDSISNVDFSSTNSLYEIDINKDIDTLQKIRPDHIRRIVSNARKNGKKTDYILLENVNNPGQNPHIVDPRTKLAEDYLTAIEAYDFIESASFVTASPYRIADGIDRIADGIDWDLTRPLNVFNSIFHEKSIKNGEKAYFNNPTQFPENYLKIDVTPKNKHSKTKAVLQSLKNAVTSSLRSESHEPTPTLIPTNDNIDQDTIDGLENSLKNITLNAQRINMSLNQESIEQFTKDIAYLKASLENGKEPRLAQAPKAELTRLEERFEIQSNQKSRGTDTPQNIKEQLSQNFDNIVHVLSNKISDDITETNLATSMILDAQINRLEHQK